MRIIGLTGGIGSGKSSVSRVLAREGARVIDADHITHVLESRGQTVWQQIVDRFGWAVLLPDGNLDRKKLGWRVFHDEAERQALNQLVHPAVQQEIWRQVDQARAEALPAVVLDVPLLIEGGLFRMVDQVWVVLAEPEQQATRIQARDRVSAASAWRRIAAQMPLKEKIRYADVVIDNRRQFSGVEERVKALWRSVVADG